MLVVEDGLKIGFRVTLVWCQEHAAIVENALEVVEPIENQDVGIKVVNSLGAMVGGNRLKPSDTATTVRTVGGAQSLHDGPYAETREQLAGYYLVEAPDLDAAIGWAKKIPGGPNYAVEVRPIWPLA